MVDDCGDDRGEAHTGRRPVKDDLVVLFFRLAAVFLPKLILEVLGSAGAIWGCSEAIGLRSATNVWFWRPVALSIGLMFLVRWLVEMRRFLDVRRHQELVGEADALVLTSTEYGS